MKDSVIIANMCNVMIVEEVQNLKGAVVTPEWLDRVERQMKDATRGFSFSRPDALREHLVEYILRHNGVSAFGVTPIGN